MRTDGAVAANLAAPPKMDLGVPGSTAKMAAAPAENRPKSRPGPRPLNAAATACSTGKHTDAARYCAGHPGDSSASQPYDCARNRHLFGPGPKRILALDGGGVRGAISAIAFLERYRGPSFARAPGHAGPAGRLVRPRRWHLDRRPDRRRARARVSHRADQGVLSPAGAARLSADPMGHSAVPGEVQRRRAARRDPEDRGGSAAFQHRSHHRPLRGHQAHGHLQSLDRRQQSERALLGGQHHP